MLEHLPRALDELRRGPQPSYSLRELAGIWRVHRVTVSRWLAVLRREGAGPKNGQVHRRIVYGRQRELIIRADYALVIQARFLERSMDQFDR